MVEPFFFAAAGGQRLFGIWRSPENPARLWVVCPSFGEEEKSSRRALTELCLALNARGIATLLFAYRGTGDSEGEFAVSTLEDWRADIASACAEAAGRAPGIPLELCGLRLGASLAFQAAPRLHGLSGLTLIEPILGGRAFLAQMSFRKKLRAELTEATPASAGKEPQNIVSEAPARPPSSTANAEYEDLDGWPLGTQLKEDLRSLDLRQPVATPGQPLRVLQVGPRPEVAPPLQAFAGQCGGTVRAVVMPPFWNLLDYTPARPLLEALLEGGTSDA